MDTVRSAQISSEHSIIELEYAEDEVFFAHGYDEIQNVSTTSARIALRVDVNM